MNRHSDTSIDKELLTLTPNNVQEIDEYATYQSYTLASFFLFEKNYMLKLLLLHVAVLHTK